MDPKRLVLPSLIVGTFGLGLLLGLLVGFSVFRHGDGSGLTRHADLYLLVAILGVASGLVGLTVGAVANASGRPSVWSQGGTGFSGGGLPPHVGHSLSSMGPARTSLSPGSAMERADGERGRRYAEPAAGGSRPVPEASAPTSEPTSAEGVHREPRERTGVDHKQEWPHYSRSAPAWEAAEGADSSGGLAGGGPETGSFASVSEPQPAGFVPEDLIRVWEAYEAEGDGHFTAAGLARGLDAAGLDARAVSGEELGVGDAVLGVVSTSDDRRIYVLPDFNRPSSALSRWFEDQGSGVRTAPIKRLLEVAEAEIREGELAVRRKGVVA